MLKLQIFTLALLFAAILFLYSRMHTGCIAVKYTLPWIVLIIVMAIITVFPELIYETAAFLGVETPSNMLYYIGTLLMLVIIYNLTVTVSRQSKQIAKITQEMGLFMEKTERELKKNAGKTEKKTDNKKQ